jgi:type I restriction enzyme S subunit
MNDYNSNKKTGKALIPRLRFPEFQNATEWEAKRIGEFLTEYKARVKDSINNQNVDVVSVGELGLRKRNEVYSFYL